MKKLLTSMICAAVAAVVLIPAAQAKGNPISSFTGWELQRHWQQKVDSWQEKIDVLRDKNQRLIEENAQLQQQHGEHTMSLQYMREQNGELRGDNDYLKQQNEELYKRCVAIEKVVLIGKTPCCKKRSHPVNWHIYCVGNKLDLFFSRIPYFRSVLCEKAPYFVVNSRVLWLH